MSQASLPLGRLISARNAVYAVFTINGIAFASWASRIPDAKAVLGLTPGQLGMVLLFASAGSIIGLPVAGHIVKRIGAARTCAIAMVVLGAGLALVGLGVDIAHNRWVVAAGLFVLGLGMGTCDVAMNLEGANVERLLERSIMPRFHAAFSGGTVLAALFGAGMAALKVPVWLHLVTVAAILVLASGMSTRSFLPRSLEGEPQDAASPAPSTRAPSTPARSAWTEPRTILIGLVTLVAAFTEGTANDWVSVAFVEGYDLPAWAGVLAFATFLGFMTIGRILGTGLLDRYGRVPTLRVMLAVALLGSLMVVFGGPALAYVGAALWGLGVSLGFPVGMSAAADDPDRAHARVSVIATIGYVAFIAGPPLVGFLGDHHGVLRALLAVGALIVLAYAALPAVREPGTTRLRSQ